MEGITSTGIRNNGKAYFFDQMGGVSLINEGIFYSSFDIYDKEMNILTTITYINPEYKKLIKLRETFIDEINKPTVPVISYDKLYTSYTSLSEENKKLMGEKYEFCVLSTSLSEENERLIAENLKLKQQLKEALAKTNIIRKEVIITHRKAQY